MQRINLYLKLINYVPVIIIGFFIVLLIIGGFIVWPKVREYSDLRGEVEIKEIELGYKEEYIAKLQDLKAKLTEKQSEVSKISSAIPADISTPSVYKFMEESASASGMILDNISPFDENLSNINSRLNETSFSLELTGSYPAFKAFLSVLEKSARLFDMHSISLSSTEDEDVFEFQLSVRVFNY
ncbi:MAG: type 4a pilus biogenesis protein PilO [Candidatus Paceibacterota bacterium]|jgi:Tfp pilus assembly protein PilO